MPSPPPMTLEASASTWIGTSLRRPWVMVAALVILFAVVVLAQIYRDRTYDAFRVDNQALYIRSGDALGRMALSFDAVLADVYWVRAIQHYGQTKRSDADVKQYELLYPLLDITTTLDPRFNIAYRFGAIFLTEGYPNGPGRPDQAVALLQKGVRAMPARWQYLVDIGFVYYWWLHEYEEAARWFRRAGELPGASWWVEPLAANTLAIGGNREDSRRLWQQMYDTADDEWMRAEAARRLMQLNAMDQIDHYTSMVERVTAASGQPPTEWAALVEAGDIPPGVPLDPAGYPLVLGSSGTVTLSQRSPLFPLPLEPPATRALPAVDPAR